MNIIPASYEIVSFPDVSNCLKIIELSGRVCYKSEHKISDFSSEPFVRNIVISGHESVIEHQSATVKFVADRGFLAEITRHRIASFSVESSRYANYSKEKFGSEITVIEPLFFKKGSIEYNSWMQACLCCEQAYMSIIANGGKAEEARSVLPLSLKTEIIMTANFREWRHIFKLRCNKAAHPQMRELMIPLRDEFSVKVPSIFANVE